MNERRGLPRWMAAALLLIFLCICCSCSFILAPSALNVVSMLSFRLSQLTAPTFPVVTPQQPVVEAPAQQSLIARDLGPWAPNGNQGENFEITCNETNCRGTHVQLWWPAGTSQPWGMKEISVFIPAGLSIEVQNGAGKGFEYPLGFSLLDIQSQIASDNGRRITDTSYYGVVDIDYLISTGLVVVRFDRRGQ